MCEYLLNAMDSAAAFFDVPVEDVFLLLGSVLGFLLGWIFGRQRPRSSGELHPGGVAAEPDTGGRENPAPSSDVRLVVNGKTVNVAPAVMEEIQGLIRAGDKIEAIKLMRSATGLGLAAAKSVVESLESAIHS